MLIVIARHLTCCLLLLASTQVVTAQTTLPKLARGVLTVVPGEVAEQDTVTGPLAMDELVEAAPEWSPNFNPKSDTLREIAKNITLRRPIWKFEFAAKPLRMTTVQYRGEELRVWYLVYRLRNTGGHLKPLAQNGGRSYTVVPYNRSLRFFPHFVLRDHEHELSYLDSVIPPALAKIHAIEIRDPNVRLYDSVSISGVTLETSSDEVDRSVWGVATWAGVDRRADFLSVYVQGLTNAYRWNAGREGERKLLFKTLQLNYWRPGDAVLEHRGEFRVGLPIFQEGPELDRALRMYDMDERSDYVWVYRP